MDCLHPADVSVTSLSKPRLMTTHEVEEPICTSMPYRPYCNEIFASWMGSKRVSHPIHLLLRLQGHHAWQNVHKKSCTAHFPRSSQRSRADVWSAGLPSTTLRNAPPPPGPCAGDHWSLSSVLPALDSHVATLHQPPLSEHQSVGRSWSSCSFRFDLWAAAPPKQVRVVTTHECDRRSSRSCPCCAWLCASCSTGTSRRRHAYTD